MLAQTASCITPIHSRKKIIKKKIPGPQWSAQSSQSSIVAVATHIRRSFKSQQPPKPLKDFCLEQKNNAARGPKRHKQIKAKEKSYKLKGQGYVTLLMQSVMMFFCNIFPHKQQTL